MYIRKAPRARSFLSRALARAFGRGFYCAPPTSMHHIVSTLKRYGVHIARVTPVIGCPGVWYVVPARSLGRWVLDRRTGGYVLRRPGQDMRPWALHIINEIMFPRGSHPFVAIPFEIGDPRGYYYGDEKPQRAKLWAWNAMCATSWLGDIAHALYLFTVQEGRRAAETVWRRTA